MDDGVDRPRRKLVPSFEEIEFDHEGALHDLAAHVLDQSSGGALAYALGTGLQVVRKPGKLPYRTKSASYELEYGTDTIEIHIDAIAPGTNVLLVDDLIATGGSLAAAARLLEKAGAKIVESCVVIELSDLGGRQKIAPLELFSLVKFHGE